MQFIAAHSSLKYFPRCEARHRQWEGEALSEPASALGWEGEAPPEPASALGSHGGSPSLDVSNQPCARYRCAGGNTNPMRQRG